MKTKCLSMNQLNLISNDPMYMLRVHRVYRDEEPSGGLKQTIRLILGIIATKIKIAKAKGEINAMNILISLYKFGEKVLYKKELMMKWIKVLKDYAKITVQMWLKKFFLYILNLMIISYQKENAAEKAAEMAKIAEKAAQSTSKDTAEHLMIYRDCMSIASEAFRLHNLITIRKIMDDRRRISTTKTPTVWEVRTVLGIKPGVSFNEKEWKAYKENGMVIVQNRNKPEIKHSRSINELISIANREKMEIMDKTDPYVANAYEQYNSGYMPAPEKNKIQKVLRGLLVTLKGVLAVAGTINLIKAATKGWGADIRDLVATLLLAKQKVDQTLSSVSAAKAV